MLLNRRNETVGTYIWSKDGMGYRSKPITGQGRFANVCEMDQRDGKVS